MMFGYATDETPQLFPLPALLAHKMAQRLAEVRKSGVISGLRPDGKTQVTVEYDDDIPVRIDTVVLSTQHEESKSHELLRDEVQREVIDHVLQEVSASLDYSLKTTDYRVLVNPTGSFTIGGPQGDAGLTGRKIIVDTYGGVAHHGGGAFSGKDPSKVDRSAAYAMRWVAKHIVAAGLAKRAELQVAYAIGVAKPVGMFINTFGTSSVPEDQIIRAVNQVFDLRPASIIRDLDLLKPIYRQTASYGHFGRDDLNLPWERLDRVEELKAAVKNVAKG
jgi:S-adenosylmethionine synthetase